MKTPTQKGVLIEFVFGDAPIRNGYEQIGSFKFDAPDWPHIYVTGPVEWVNAKETDPEALKDFLTKITKGFLDAFNMGQIDTSKDRFRYYLIDENEDTTITLSYFYEDEQGSTLKDAYLLDAEEFLKFQNARDKIAEFYRDTLWFNPIIENYINFHKTVQAVLENFLKSGRPDYSGVEIVRINAAFNNYLTSITSYLNHMEKILKSRNSKVYWEQYRKHTSEQYDQSVSSDYLTERLNCYCSPHTA